MSLTQSTIFPPGPRGHWLLGCLEQKRSDPISFFRSNREQFGDIASFRFGPVKVFQLNSPELIGAHFQSKHESCWRGRTFRKLRPILGDGLFTAEGDVWSAARKQLRPCFAKGIVESFEDQIRSIAYRTSLEIPHQRPVDVKQLSANAALEVVFSCLFAVDCPVSYVAINQLTESIKRTAHYQIHTLLSRFQWLPTANNRMFWEATKQLRAISAQIVEIGRAGTRNPSILSRLIEQHNSGQISFEMLIDQVTTLVVTGHETVANTLCWALELLALDPAAQEKFAHAAVQTNALEGKEYLEAVVKEVIRLYPAAWIISYEAKEKHHLLGWEIPRNALILTIPYVTHRDPQLWPDPEVFMPERFCGATSQTAMNPHQYIPFGGGSRFCIGRTLAEFEIRIILEELLKRFRVKKALQERTPAEFSMTLKLAQQMLLEFELRVA